MTLVKICGITNLEDARAAIDAGADMLGFNFYRGSRRFIEPKKVRAITEALRPKAETPKRKVTIVGVFVNEPSPESVLGVANEAGLEAVQLHGDESVEFCRNLKVLLKERFLIKAFSAGDNFEPEHATEYKVDAIMLDAFHSELRGGTGRLVDWSTARRTRAAVPRLFLAGGLSPENVAAAIAAVEPYAVDACSSLESSPGKKIADRVRAFVCAVRSG
jgi:phosphoribosylanthranilate isomerase